MIRYIFVVKLKIFAHFLHKILTVGYKKSIMFLKKEVFGYVPEKKN